MTPEQSSWACVLVACLLYLAAQRVTDDDPSPLGALVMFTFGAAIPVTLVLAVYRTFA